jgi:hypothetical protein
MKPNQHHITKKLGKKEIRGDLVRLRKFQQSASPEIKEP